MKYLIGIDWANKSESKTSQVIKFKEETLSNDGGFYEKPKQQVQAEIDNDSQVQRGEKNET